MSGMLAGWLAGCGWGLCRRARVMGVGVGWGRWGGGGGGGGRGDLGLAPPRPPPLSCAAAPIGTLHPATKSTRPPSPVPSPPTLHPPQPNPCPPSATPLRAHTCCRRRPVPPTPPSLAWKVRRHCAAARGQAGGYQPRAQAARLQRGQHRGVRRLGERHTHAVRWAAGGKARGVAVGGCRVGEGCRGRRVRCVVWGIRQVLPALPARLHGAHHLLTASGSRGDDHARSKCMTE